MTNYSNDNTDPRSTIRRVTLAAGGGLAVAMLAACGSSGGSGTATSPAGPVTAGTTSTTARTPTQPAHTGPTTTPAQTGRAGGADQLVAAAATARDELGRGTVTSIDLEKHGTVWEVEITTNDGVEHELRISRDGTTVTSGPRTERQSAKDKRENQHEIRSATVDYRSAAQKILAARAGTITELNLDDHRGGIVWEADVINNGTKYEVVLDAATGKIISNEPDHDDTH